MNLIKKYIIDLLYFFKVKKIYQTIHIRGIYPNIMYIDNGGYQQRNYSTINLIKTMFNTYHSDFWGKKLDFWIYTGDRADEANHIRRILRLDYIYAYSTTDKLENKVIPIPDFIFESWKEIGIESYEETRNKCILSGKEQYKFSKCFWIGTKKLHKTRELLIELSKQYPEYLEAVSSEWLTLEVGKRQIASKFISIYDHAKYKYLIDIQSLGYSGRLKLLFLLNRVIFVVKREHKEFYFSYLKDGENCIFVEENLEDLISKIKLLENNSLLYENIRKGGAVLVENYFTKEYIISYLKNTIIKRM